MLTRESLRFIRSDVDCNIHSSRYGYQSATPLEIAWNALVRGKSGILHLEAMRSHTNEVQQIERCTDRCSQEMLMYVLYTVEKLMASTRRMTMLPEPIMAEGNEDVTEKNCKHSRRVWPENDLHCFLLYRLKTS